jgi:hypothetical protein
VDPENRGIMFIPNFGEFLSDHTMTHKIQHSLLERDKTNKKIKRESRKNGTKTRGNEGEKQKERNNNK